MVTLADVARLVGVSVMTVSNVVNGRPGVSEELRARIQEALESTGYRPNPSARALKSGRTGVIGLAVPSLAAPYFAQLAARIATAAVARGYRVAVEQTGARASGELEAIATSRRMALDGLILSVVGAAPADLRTLAADGPLVLLGERTPDRAIDHVSMPNEAGAEAATRHLIERGARRIAFIGGEHDRTDDGVGRRLAGYRRALADAGLPPTLLTVPDLTLAAGREAVAHLEPDVDALLAVTDTVALGALRGLADAGRSVPGDVRVVGFDDLEEAAFSVPSLTSVRPDHEGMASLAVELLIRRIEGHPPPAASTVATFDLVTRESSP